MTAADAPEPQGELVLRTLAMPRDTNANGDIFGGWLLSQMDLAGGMACKNEIRTRVATVGVEAMSFHNAVHVGDAVCVYAAIERIGRTSLTVALQAWAVRGATAGERIKVTEGTFTYVAIDEDGNATPVAGASG